MIRKVQTVPEADIDAARLNPTMLDRPAFAMNAPFSSSADQANNAWMEEMSPSARAVDLNKAMRQFLELYYFVASEALVYLVPAPSNCGLQDLVFTANLGICLEHLPDKNTIVLANYSTAPRIGETEVGLRFLSLWVIAHASHRSSLKGKPI